MLLDGGGLRPAHDGDPDRAISRAVLAIRRGRLHGLLSDVVMTSVVLHAAAGQPDAPVVVSHALGRLGRDGDPRAWAGCRAWARWRKETT